MRTPTVTMVTPDADNYEVAGRDEVSVVGTVYATYAHDPKTASDSPRAVLTHSNVIKISISDPDRDLRTAILLPAGNAPIADDVQACYRQP